MGFIIKVNLLRFSYMKAGFFYLSMQVCSFSFYQSVGGYLLSILNFLLILNIL